MTLPNPVKSLQHELRRLSKRQSASLQMAVFIKMDAMAAAQYDLGAKRIGEIIKLLNSVTNS